MVLYKFPIIIIITIIIIIIIIIKQRTDAERISYIL